jgi:hypothetical protein
MTGIRSWIGAISALALVVMMVHLGDDRRLLFLRIPPAHNHLG